MPADIIESSDLHDAIEDVSAKAVNADADAAAALRRWKPKIKGDVPVTPDDVLGAFVAGIHAGSVAATRAWLHRSPATFLGYYSDKVRVVGKHALVVTETDERFDFIR